MALPNLVRLFGPEATRNSREPFSRHFANRTRRAVATLPTHDNPYLWQLLLGRFPPGFRYPWLDMASPARMPQITEFIGSMDSALTGSDTEFDLIHLSNILDWLDPEQARRTLELAAERLCPGGYVLIRQLNSTLNIPSLGGGIEWRTNEADALHARDRSFFYRRLHLGRKR
jgi:S-adenosylmethionine-diacylglycerol 3-amino-3-carboxypropyl transferase